MEPRKKKLQQLPAQRIKRPLRRQVVPVGIVQTPNRPVGIEDLLRDFRQPFRHRPANSTRPTPPVENPLEIYLRSRFGIFIRTFQRELKKAFKKIIILQIM
jgi:hypothetical protein